MQQARRLGFVINNSRFLLLVERERHLNLASKFLGLSLRRVAQDWQERWEQRSLMAKSFVDESRFRGAAPPYSAPQGCADARKIWAPTEHRHPRFSKGAIAPPSALALFWRDDLRVVLFLRGAAPPHSDPQGRADARKIWASTEHRPPRFSKGAIAPPSELANFGGTTSVSSYPCVAQPRPHSDPQGCADAREIWAPTEHRPPRFSKGAIAPRSALANFGRTTSVSSYPCVAKPRPILLHRAALTCGKYGRRRAPARSAYASERASPPFKP